MTAGNAQYGRRRQGHAGVWGRICLRQDFSGTEFVRGRICLGQRHHAAALPEVADLRGDSHRHMVPVSRCFCFGLVRVSCIRCSVFPHARPAFLYF